MGTFTLIMKVLAFLAFAAFVGLSQSVLEDVALNKTGTAAQMACTVLPMLEIAPLLPLRKSLSNLLLPRRLLPPRRIVMVLSAPEDVALSKTGTAAQMVCTVLLMLEIVPLLPLRKS